MYVSLVKSLNQHGFQHTILDVVPLFHVVCPFVTYLVEREGKDSDSISKSSQTTVVILHSNAFTRALLEDVYCPGLRRYS